MSVMHMENSTNSKELLDWLLHYELGCSARHRRFVSLVMLSSNDVQSRDFQHVLDDSIRDSDAAFQMDNEVVVVMGETDSSGALKAVERYQRMMAHQADARYAVSSFPIDGKAPSDLLDAARRRLSRAIAAPQNHSVVAEG